MPKQNKEVISMFGDVTRVGANFHAQEAWGNLKKVNGQIGQIQSRLSTGKRINSAEDDTSGYALSKHLESRVRGLSQGLENVGTAKNVLNIAEGGYQAQMSLLQDMKEKATQAADGSWSEAQRDAIHDQYEALMREFDDIAADTQFNDRALFGETTTFQVGEKNGDTLAAVLSNSVTGASTQGDGSYSGSAGVTNADSTDNITDGTANNGTSGVGEDAVVIGDLSLGGANGTSASEAITRLDSAIKSLAKSIQKVGDYNARLSSKEESLSLAISNTEATRSRVEDADFAKEQMNMMKLQILQQTSVSSFSQANAAPQMVLGLLR
jgi:flagellin